jgi:hypothetical protein
VLPRVEALLPPGWEPCGSPLVDHLFSLRVGGPALGSRAKNFHLLYGGFIRHARSLDLDEVLHALESHLHLYVGEHASNRVFLHAGVVGWRGRALLLPGASRAGKSTLVAALLRAGASYYSDEYAVLDPHGLVHPFARPLSLRSANGAAPRRCGPEELGARAGQGPLPVGLVAGGSMRPTLQDGDPILTNKLAYGLRLPLTHAWLLRWSGPRRGDVVLLSSPINGGRLVKRVVGVPGDRVRHGPRTVPVPEGQYFVLGDHPNSLDSRTFGCVPRERILGRVVGPPCTSWAPLRVGLTAAPSP